MQTESIIQQIWPQWTPVEQLGKGSYGTVFKAVRNDTRVQTTSAIKVIPVPQDKAEQKTLMAEGMTEADTKKYFKGIVDDFVEEIALMDSLKGIQNIVSIEDYQVVENPDTNGWIILVRMELLTPFDDYIMDHLLEEEEVIRVGMGICAALVYCERRNIIHRDIKPENIFVNEFGSFKLGDFGIARRFESMTASHSQKGTFNYMAPEVTNGTHYDARVDIYSLGVVLYRLMNQNYLPFINEENRMNPMERKRALERRLNGEQLPPPINASEAMSNVILRACAYKPEDRFATAAEFRKALLEVKNGTYVIVPLGGITEKLEINDQPLDATVSIRSEKKKQDPDATVSIRRRGEKHVESPEEEQTSEAAEPAQNDSKKTMFGLFIVVVVEMIAIVILLLLFLKKYSFEDSNESESSTVAYSGIATQDIERVVPISAEHFLTQ